MTSATDPKDPPTAAPSTPVAATSLATSRRPYTPPRLRHLGSVRELTLGGTMGFSDGLGGFIPPMM